MRCLLVEDDPRQIETILPQLQALIGEANVVLSQSRESAIAQIDSVFFDFVILDQKIPTTDGGFDPDVAHGRAVFQHIRQRAPATPVLFLSALPMEEEYVDRLLVEARRLDVWGMNRTVPLVQRFRKRDLTAFLAGVTELVGEIATTDQIELNTLGRELDLCEEDERILRVFTRRQGGAGIRLVSLSGGLSGARVLLGKVIDANGRERLAVVCKLGTAETIDDEIARYGRDVVRLAAGSYPTLLRGEPESARDRRGAFYRLLEGFDRSVFDLLRESEEIAIRAVKRVDQLEMPWTNAAHGQLVRVKSILEKMVAPRKLSGIRRYLNGLPWEAFEERQININECTRHGDLHGENIRATPDGHATIIDFGEVDGFPSSIDAVTLELSIYFHPNGSGREMLPAGTEFNWPNVEEFAGVSPYPQFVRGCRDWAIRSAFGEREILACAYAYLVRQLQYEEANRMLAISLIKGILRRAARV